MTGTTWHSLPTEISLLCSDNGNQNVGEQFDKQAINAFSDFELLIVYIYIKKLAVFSSSPSFMHLFTTPNSLYVEGNLNR